MHHRHFTKRAVDSGKALLKPGNVLVTHGTGLIDKFIQIFTLSRWNHAALVVSKEGDLIELVTQGIRRGHISAYPPEDAHIVDIELGQEDRKQVIDYAHFMLKKHPTYGFLTTATILFKIITKSRLVIKLDGTLICSEFVARALAEGGVIWDKDPSLITPADLYNKFIAK